MNATSHVKRKRVFAGGTCPRCGKPLMNRINRRTNEPFVGCGGFPDCTYIVAVPKEKAYFEALRFPNGWFPKYTDNVFKLLETCGSKPEIEYFLGAAYYLDFECGLSDKPLGMTLSTTDILYQGKRTEAIRFNEPYEYWGGGTAPSAMAFVPQLEFAGRLHHDFGVFFSSEHSATPSDWWFALAVEVDIHPIHDFKPGIDWKRDSLVSYPVLRLKAETDEPCRWFHRVKRFWDNKFEN